MRGCWCSSTAAAPDRVPCSVFSCAVVRAVAIAATHHMPVPRSCRPVSPRQTEKAFQKQDCVFAGAKGKKVRYTRTVGLGFKTPKAAVEGGYIDKKCPFTGNVNIRGRILKGVVVSTKMTRTVVIRRDYLRFVRKYRRCVQCSVCMCPPAAAHSSPCAGLRACLANLCPPQFREAPQHPVRPLLARVPRQGGRCCDCWPVPPAV